MQRKILKSKGKPMLLTTPFTIPLFPFGSCKPILLLPRSPFGYDSYFAFSSLCCFSFFKDLIHSIQSQFYLPFPLHVFFINLFYHSFMICIVISFSMINPHQWTYLIEVTHFFYTYTHSFITYPFLALPHIHLNIRKVMY